MPDRSPLPNVSTRPIRSTAATSRLLRRRMAANLAVGCFALGTCGHAGTRFPWPAAGGKTAVPHAEVTTLNNGYDRRASQLLVRRITRPTRANLDYAAYHANFMNADPAPEGAPAAGTGRRPDISQPFEGALEVGSLTGSFAALPLTAEERRQPLALAPLVELLTSKHIAGADALEEVVAKVRAEDWGLGGGPQLVRQVATEAYIHQPAGAHHGSRTQEPPQLWVKVELAPWFRDFSDVPDTDGDGYGELYGRVPPAALKAAGPDFVAFVRDEYAHRLLSLPEIKAWAHQLASYWYPSYNTDLLTPGARWPDDETEPAIRREVGQQIFDAPTVVMRGKPEGKPVYNVFLVSNPSGGDGTAPSAEGGAPGRGAPAAARKLSLPRGTPSPRPAPVAAAIEAELGVHGGAWSRWSAEAAPIHEIMRRKLKAIPAGAKATAGDGGFLFFGQSLAYATGGDLEKQKRGRNPVPIIVQFQKLLADHGVDLLFVPVPTKEEVFPDRLATTTDDKRAAAPFVGRVVNPFQRKFLLDLATKGVEAVDLLPLFLDARKRDRDEKTALFQRQDTHWTDAGIALTARAVADRIKTYPWYKDIAPHRVAFKTKAVSFSRHGDLHSRLPENDKARFQAEELRGQQVFTSEGQPYEDDPDSPIVVLGDSFTGVYQLMDCEHAGVSAHIAKEIGYPVDLVMSYGGGPNVRQKLLRRGADALRTKKLVIWMMTARDLYDFWEGWQPATLK